MRGEIVVRVAVFAVFAVVAVIAMGTEDPDEGVSRHRKGKFWWPVFTIVRFPNYVCPSSKEQTNGNGTCLSERECLSRGGEPAGRCATGYGTCCFFHRTCGSSTRENNTYFQNPGYPSPFRGMGTCHLLVYKVRNDICQVRLDFLEFQTAGPSLRADTAGQCLTDRFTVAGMHNMAQVPQVCGSNQGQHMYLDVDMEEAPIMVNMIIMGGDISRKWNIRIAQIPCGILTAPVGCLQWFTGLHGEVKSFNFDENSVHLADQHYTVCVRSESDFCSIEWRAVGSNEENSTVTGAFSISDGMPSGAFPVAGTDMEDPGIRTGTPVEPTCTGAPGRTDYVGIRCGSGNGGRIYNVYNASSGSSVETSCSHKFCGTALHYLNGFPGHGTVYSQVRPFQLEVYTDSSETGDGGDGGGQNRGFYLEWTQRPCATFKNSRGER